jgi:hypothetical protein
LLPESHSGIDPALVPASRWNPASHRALVAGHAMERYNLTYAPHQACGRR